MGKLGSWQMVSSCTPDCDIKALEAAFSALVLGTNCFIMHITGIEEGPIGLALRLVTVAHVARSLLFASQLPS